MKRLVVGVWQGECADGQVDKNFSRTGEVIDEAAEAGCDFVCLPEFYLTGYGTREIVEAGAIGIDDRRLLDLAGRARDRGVVTLVGLGERRGRRIVNTQAILDEGKVAGAYSKTIPTRAELQMGVEPGSDLPVFHARGICFGIQICHDSSYPEIAATLAWKGARVIFSPHYNKMPAEKMDRHRIMVRNKHIGSAAAYGVVMARSNVVGIGENQNRLGYGDSAIFCPTGEPIAEAGLFTERLVWADVSPYVGKEWCGHRLELRMELIEQYVQAARETLEREAPKDAKAVQGNVCE